MKCLVTGCAGFIGSHLSEALASEGHSVLGVDCFTDYYPRRIKASNLLALRKTKRFELVEADLSSAKLPPLLRDVEYVFHLAAQPGVRASWGTSFSHYVKDNVVATQRLLEAAKHSPTIKSFVFASSSSIYGDAEAFPTPESAAPRPVSPYGATKLAGENLCHVYFRNYSVPAVALRYFTVYGPRQRPDMAFNIFISKMTRGEEIEVYGDGEQRRDFTFVADTVAATMLASQARPGSVYNVGGGSSTSLNHVISIIESIMGKKARIKLLHGALGDVRDTSANIRRIRTDLGYKPGTTLADGLKKQVAAQLE
ncbi:MAG TPA: NAD-dependent epimerase/dehydratase family protein [Nitrososphaerales archaeon]|nr:NAD-dependent epimerase/dehydratase family protein [Nitrososphaerales archaeon]